MDGTSVSGTDARGSCEEPSLGLVSLGELLDSQEPGGESSKQLDIEGWNSGERSFPPLGKMRPLPATASQEKSHVPFPSGEPGVSGDSWGSQEGCQGPFRPSGQIGRAHV